PIRGNPQTEFASKLRPKSYNPAKSNTARRLFNLADQWLGNSSRPTNATNLKIAFSGKVAAGFPKKMRPNL
ncbi:MAG: hypothetical protein WB624_25110, partial [Xanthobacteraceae bacterium]